ncbi:hypothetical protein NQ315_005791 [Exocentrus adspersus]|uniref:Nuclear RNA export factor 1 n=1 Tax=Exocentrus adspersus TaxID=1586481 RepID=A0AAV8VQP8_9CUCU|nr:hypothetical protein NQ315_005791 [Exocentrus adspersus]
MPKPHFENKQPWMRNDRERDRDRRVTFKPSSRFGGKKEYGNRDWSNAIREHLQDEDVDMGVSSGTGRNFNNKKFGKGRKGRKGSPIPNNRQPRKLLEGPTSWYKISIPHGEKYDKNFLLKTLLEKVAPLPFWPIAWQVYGTTSTFYVDDYKVAEKLLNLDRQVQLPNGFRLLIRVHPGSPNVDMSSTTKEKMKLVMAKRYNAPTKALDLTKFHADPDLQDYFCALFKPIVFLTVVDIIAENIPELEALNLFDNKISVLSFLRKSMKKVPNLKILHMGNNKLREITQLDSLQGLPIIDLVLDGNPLCDKFKDQATYISFDIAEEHHVPETRQTFLCNADGSSIVRQFLEQYFLIYDSENRQPLLQAYHENALFSMTMAYPYGYGKDKNVAWLNWYATDNRNLMRVQDSERRHKLLRQGHLAVVSFLQEMPLTKHDIHSFTVDLTIFTPQMLCLTVSGIFKEIKSGHKIPPIRFFFRTLVIVPAGSGFCIANEILHVTNALPEQAKWRVHGTACIFYVDEYKVAEKLLDLNRQIQLPNGFWLPIRVHPGAPNIDINSTIKEKMKLVMAKRYNAGTKALDLTKFHADPDLQDYFCALFKSTIFLAVIDIIAENIPELEALNLFDNKLSGLNVFKKSLKKIPKLKILHMGHNKLKDIAQLDPLQGFPIVDLVLDGNPLCDKFEDQATYISEVRKRFPKCMKLDSFDLPPPIGFDITEEHHVPSTQKIFLCNADASSVAQQCLLFLQQYFQVYDTEDRQPLLQAYHENAMFSMTMAYPHRYGKDKNVAWLNWYAADNRNVKKVQDTEKRYLLLRQGQSAIINYLKDMPLTEHDIHGFTVDFTICTPDMLCLTVSGIFKEINNGHKTPPFRFFFRTLVLVPAGSGFCIVNELLHISNALPNQAKDAFKNAVAGEPSNPGTSSADSVSSTVQQVVPSVPVLDDATKQEMVHQMSSQSGMNLEWSFKCLDETHWDFQRAIEVFQQFKSRGVIPEEAFVQ